MIPPAFLRIDARLEFGRGRTAGRARSAASGHVEPLFLEHVERLFDRRVFQEKPKHTTGMHTRKKKWPFSDKFDRVFLEFTQRGRGGGSGCMRSEKRRT